MVACLACQKACPAAESQIGTHLLADLDGGHHDGVSINGERGHHVGHVTDVGAVSNVEHVGRGLHVAEAEGDPGANPGAQAAQPHGDQPGALRVRDKAAEGVLHQPLAGPEADADERVSPASPHMSLQTINLFSTLACS